MLGGLLSKLHLGKVLSKVPGAIKKGSQQVLRRDVMTDEGFARWIDNTRLALKAKRDTLQKELDRGFAPDHRITRVNNEIDRLNKDLAEIDEDIPLELKTRLKQKYFQTIDKDMQFKGGADKFTMILDEKKPYLGSQQTGMKLSKIKSQAERNWRKKHGLDIDDDIPADLMGDFASNTKIMKARVLRSNKLRTNEIIPDLKDFDYMTRRVKVSDKTFPDTSLMDRLSTGAHELKHALQSKFTSHRYAIRHYMPHVDTNTLSKGDWFKGRSLNNILENAPGDLLAKLQSIKGGLYANNEWVHHFNKQIDEFGYMPFRDADFKVPKGLMKLLREWNDLNKLYKQLDDEIIHGKVGSKAFEDLINKHKNTSDKVIEKLYEIDNLLYHSNPDEISARLTEIRGIPKSLRNSSSELREIKAVAGKGESIKNVLDKAWGVAPLTSMGLIERLED